MPRVYITNNERLCARLASWVYGEMKIQKIPQRVLADKRGCSQQAISDKLKNQRFDFEDFVCFVELFKPDDAELHRLLGGKLGE